MLHDNPQLVLNFDLLLEDCTRMCILMIFPSEDIKEIMMRCISPDDEDLRRLMPPVLFESDNRDGQTFLGEHSALPLVLMADDEPLVKVGPNINWETWRIVEVRSC